MEKRKEKADLEQLLNSLIEKGWKPFGKANRGYVSIDSTIHTKSPFFDFENHNMSVSTRELIAKESGLWQFVCENGYNQYKKEYRRGYTKYNTKAEYWDEGDYEYYLIESSLKDESELEQFLLDNIMMEGVKSE